MKQLNFPIDDNLHDAAKLASRRAGMYFKAWIVRAITAAIEAEGGGKIRLKEPVVGRRGPDHDYEETPRG